MSMQPPEAWSSLREAVEAILADESFDAETSLSTRTEELEKLIPRFGWPALESEAFRLLAVSGDAAHWRVAAEIFGVQLSIDERWMPRV